MSETEAESTPPPPQFDDPFGDKTPRRLTKKSRHAGGMDDAKLQKLKMVGIGVGVFFLILMLPPVRRTIWFQLYSLGLGTSSLKNWAIAGFISLEVTADESPDAIQEAAGDPDPETCSLALRELMGARVKPAGWVPNFVGNSLKTNQAAINALKREDRRLVIDAVLSPEVKLTDAQRKGAEELLTWMCQELDDGVKELLELMSKCKGEPGPTPIMRHVLQKLNPSTTFQIGNIGEFLVRAKDTFQEDMIKVYFALCDRAPDPKAPPGAPKGKDVYLRDALLNGLEKQTSLTPVMAAFVRSWEEQSDGDTHIRLQNMLRKFRPKAPSHQITPVVEPPKDKWASNALKQLEAAPKGEEGPVVKALFQDRSFGKMLQAEDSLPAFVAKVQQLGPTLDCDTLQAMATRLLTESGQGTEFLGTLLVAGAERCPGIRKDLVQLCARFPQAAGSWFAGHLAGGPPGVLWMAVSTPWPPEVVPVINEAVLGPRPSWPPSAMFLFLPENTDKLKGLLEAPPADLPLLPYLRVFSEKSRLAVGKELLESPDPKTRGLGADILGNLACSLVGNPEGPALAKEAVEILGKRLENEFDSSVGGAATRAARQLAPFTPAALPILDAAAGRKTQGSDWESLRKATLLARLSLTPAPAGEVLDSVSVDPFYGESVQGVAADWVMRKGLDPDSRISSILSLARREGETGWNQQMYREEVGDLLRKDPAALKLAQSKVFGATQVDSFGFTQALMMCPKVDDAEKLVESLFTNPAFVEPTQYRLEILHSIARSRAAALVPALVKRTRSHTPIAASPDQAPLCTAACAAHLLGDLKQDVATAGPALVALMKSQEIGDRFEACEALGKFGVEAKGFLPALSALQKDEDTSVRFAAWQATYRLMAK